MTIESMGGAANEQAQAPAIYGANGFDEMPEMEISIFDLLIALAERKRMILMVTAAAALLAIAVSFLLPVRYTAMVTIMTPQQNTSVSALLTSQMGGLSGMAALAGSGLCLKNPNDLYIGLMTGATVESSMVQHFGLMQEYHTRNLTDARKTLERRATVDGTAKDGLIRISVEDRDPRRAAELANGYVDQFRSLSQHLAITEASQRRLFFERELEVAKNDLAEAEEAMKQTEQSTGLIELSSQAKALIESAAALRAQAAAMEVRIQGMQTYATGENAELIQAQNELASLRAQLARLGGSEAGAGGEFIVPKGKVPEATLEYARKLRDVKYHETIFDILARQYELAKLDEAKQGAVIQVVDAATVPDRRTSPRRSLIVLVSTFFGFLLGIAVVLIQYVFNLIRMDPYNQLKLEVLRKAITIKG